MDIVTLISSITSSLGISVVGAWWLSKKFVEHRLAKDLEKTKTEFQKKIDKYKIERQGEIHKEVEVYLGEKSAEREYILEARKRLYTAIGPLKFQLLMACRDVCNRIHNHGLLQQYKMSMETYYGCNTLYRLLRPIAIAELIERQITYADFSVDYAAIDLLRFKKAAFMALSDSDTILAHPKASWNFQREHLFSGTLSKLINELIIQDVNTSNQERVMYFHEFEALILENTQNLKRFSPLKEILDDFEISKKPIFWIRLVCFGYICNEYTELVGNDIGFKKRQFDVQKLLLISQDNYTCSNIAKFPDIFQTITKMDL